MDRDVARAKREHLPDGIGEAFLVVVGQARDEVHVDLVKTGLPCLLERAEHIGRAVFSADRGQNGVIHALRVYAHAANARAFEHAQLFRCDGIRTARFHSIFAQM